MKNYNLTVINSKNKPVVFNVIEPETFDEFSQGLKETTTYDGMIIFPIKPEICIQPIYIQNYRYVPLDIVSVDWHGNIKSVHKNISKDKYINWHPFTVCVIEFKAGICDKFGIDVGDSVIHDKLRFKLGNKIKYVDLGCDKYKNLLKQTIPSITEENMIDSL